MSFADERTTIEVMFADAWGSTTPVVFENVSETFAPPFVALFILTGDGNQISLGHNPLYRWAGVIQVSIFTRTGIGTKLALELADRVDRIFRSRKLVSGYVFGTPSRTPARPDEGQLRIDISIPYHRDEILEG